MQAFSWTVMNLFLAALPAALAYLLAAGAGRWTVRERRVPWLVWLPLILAWFVFLPNTCYLLTEWRHFFFDAPYEAMRAAAHEDRRDMLTVAEFGLFFLLYSGFGAVCFVLSIRPIERLLREAKISLLFCAVPFFFLTSLGVYMGLIVRLNSWDILTRPGFVLGTALHALTTLVLLKIIIIFAALLWLLYQIGDVWADGMALRLRERGLLPPALPRASQPASISEPKTLRA